MFDSACMKENPGTPYKVKLRDGTEVAAYYCPLANEDTKQPISYRDEGGSLKTSNADGSYIMEGIQRNGDIVAYAPKKVTRYLNVVKGIKGNEISKLFLTKEEAEKNAKEWAFAYKYTAIAIPVEYEVEAE